MFFLFHSIGGNTFGIAFVIVGVSGHDTCKRIKEEEKMNKEWDKSKIDVYFLDAANETFVRQGFNNLVDEVTGEQLGAFTEALESLHALPVGYAVVSESYRYEN